MPDEAPDIEAGIGEKVMGLLQPQQETPPTDLPDTAAGEVPAPDAPDTEQLPIQELIAGKYRTVEDLVEAHKSLERKLGEDSQEKQELRQYREWYEQQQQAQYQQPEVISDRDVSFFEQQLEKDAAAATQWAAQRGQQTGDWSLYQHALNEWHEEDPIAAVNFATDLRWHENQQQLVQQLAPLLQPALQQARNAQWNESWNSVRREAPDIDQYGQKMMDIAKQAPELLQTLTAGTPDAQQRLIHVLYHASRSETGTHTVPSSGAPPPPPAPHVVSGETGGRPAQPAQRLDVVQAAIRQWAESEPTIEAGLTRRS